MEQNTQNNNIHAFVVNLIEKKAKLPQEYDLSFDFMQSGHIDSMGLIKFILAIESAFDIEISEADMQRQDFKTLGGIVKIIEEKKN